MTREKTSLHKRAQRVFDRAARLYRADATPDAQSCLLQAAETLRRAQHLLLEPRESDVRVAVGLADQMVQQLEARRGLPRGKL